MKIILTQEVRTLGAPGDVIEVADGYARNYLLPRKLALRATPGSLKQVEHLRRLREVREVRDREKAEELAAQLAALSIRIPARAGESGRLFGKVTTQAIVDGIVKAGGPRPDKRRIHVDAPIKSLGVHTVHLRLHPEVEASFRIEVVPA